MKPLRSNTIRFVLLLTAWGILKPSYSYCQSPDSLPLRELTNEFLKGLQARERVVILKELREYDTKLIAYYRDSIIPVKDKKVAILEADVKRLYADNERLKQANKRFSWLSFFLAVGLAYKW